VHQARVHQVRMHQVRVHKTRTQINPARDGTVADAFLFLLLVLGQAHCIGMTRAIGLPPKPKFQLFFFNDLRMVA
jgi:hypothetical protein